MKEVYRILDANFNRAREALRVVEDCGRFALNDPAITAMAKNLRSDLKEILTDMPVGEFLVSRDTPGDIGTEITSPTEADRKSLSDVATAACKRLTEALRTIEEYSKFINPKHTIRIERMRYNTYTLEKRLIGRLLVAKRFEDVQLYMLLTSSLILEKNSHPGSVRETARAALAGGVDCIQLREPNIPDGQFLAMAAELRELTDETGKLLIINNRADIAAIVGADGIHVGQHDLPIAEARRLLRPGAIVGKTTHTIAQAKAACQEGADYISIGPIFPTATKPQSETGPVVGLEMIQKIKEAVPLPIVAIGGINVENLDQVVQAGAHCIAVCSAICHSENPKASAGAFKAHLK